VCRLVVARLLQDGAGLSAQTDSGKGTNIPPAGMLSATCPAEAGLFSTRGPRPTETGPGSLWKICSTDSSRHSN
jgi:hypothetical protein